MKQISLIIIIYNDKFLLFKRSELNHQFKNMFGLIGGSVEKTETPEEAAVREAKEEIDIILPNIKHFKNYKFNNSILNIFYSFINTIDNIKLNSEHFEFKEFTIKQLLNNKEIVPTTPKIINDYLDKTNLIKELYGSFDGNDDILSDENDAFANIKYNGTNIDMSTPIMDESGIDKYSSDYGVGDSKYSIYNIEHSNDNKDNFSNDELLERRTAWINGSKGIIVKQKCKLGGGSICNQGDINNLEFSNLSLKEEIDASEAYTDDGAIKNIIQGRKSVGLISLTTKIKDLIIKNNLKLIKVIPSHHNLYIVYKTNKYNANELYKYLKLHNGYLKDRTPEEAWEIGKLLDYSDESIKKYIRRVYVDKVDNLGNKYSDARFDENMIVDPKYIDENMNIIEGIGDKYVDKKFGIKPEFDDFDKKYNEKKIKDNRENIIYNDNKLTIITNPKSLENIGSDVRGVIDKNGNLYIETKPFRTHTEILKILNTLGLIKLTDMWHLVLPTDFITVIRYGLTNKFYLGESNEMMVPDEDRYESNIYYKGNHYVVPTYMESVRRFQLFLDRAKQKNPKIDFINDMERYSFGINEETVIDNINEATKLI